MWILVIFALLTQNIVKYLNCLICPTSWYIINFYLLVSRLWFLKFFFEGEGQLFKISPFQDSYHNLTQLLNQEYSKIQCFEILYFWKHFQLIQMLVFKRRNPSFHPFFDIISGKEPFLLHSQGSSSIREDTSVFSPSFSLFDPHGKVCYLYHWEFIYSAAFLYRRQLMCQGDEDMDISWLLYFSKF